MPNRGESRAEYEAVGRTFLEKTSERRCVRKGEKSSGRTGGDAKRKCENPPISSMSIIDQFIQCANLT
ncbi:hypothetical protein NQZ68_039962 [Dissostichus eleginoides]|nr:hypothetical protein NQZ68_039962 [Dissostichus eleginoides]